MIIGILKMNERKILATVIASNDLKNVLTMTYDLLIKIVSLSVFKNTPFVHYSLLSCL